MLDEIKKRNVISAMFLVGGTCIGGGMLALPIATGISGFLPSVVVMAICWLAMTATALLLLEASLWMEEGVHVITMTSRLLGPIGKGIAWVLFLFISYASLVAYTAAGGVQISSFFNHMFNTDFSKDIGAAIFIFLFGAVIYLGSHIVGRVNAILFTAMIGAYIALVAMGVDELKPNLLTNRRWPTAFIALPLLLTSFSFQTMVPSLTPYLKRHANSLRIAIIGGTFIAFLIYVIWLGLIMGIVPADGPNGLSQALLSGEPTMQFLNEHVNGYWIIPIAMYFAFFAIVTSFLGIALGLFDFLADGLHLEKKGWGQVIIGLLIVLPTLLFAVKFERVFLLALDTSGGFGDSILNGIIPVLMVWIGRYHLGNMQNVIVPGGKVILSVILVFFVCSLGFEILAHTGHVPSIYQAYELLEVTVPELKE
jgi:tyrosine-specific transport protein